MLHVALHLPDVDLFTQVLEESDTSSEISCRKDALNLENGDFKTSIEKAITKLPRIQHLVRSYFSIDSHYKNHYSIRA